ncbi:MAG: hypothetical protein AAF547_01290 [Actinomycetota bacterium]
MTRQRRSARRWVAPFLLVVAGVLAVTGSGSDAQEPPLDLTVAGDPTGGIAGLVTAAEGAAVADARLTFFTGAEEASFVGRTFTDVFGRYRFELPGDGCYAVIVDTPAGTPAAEVHSLEGGFCVGDVGAGSAAIDLS